MPTGNRWRPPPRPGSTSASRPTATLPPTQTRHHRSTVTPRVGEPIEVAVNVAAGAAHTYTECARIWNPIHTDKAVALQAGLEDIILHGTANLAHGVSAVVEHVAGDPGLVRRIACRFAAMVLMPSTLTVRIWSAEPNRRRAANGPLRRAERRRRPGRRQRAHRPRRSLIRRVGSIPATRAKSAMASTPSRGETIMMSRSRRSWAASIHRGSRPAKPLTSKSVGRPS